MSSEKRFLFTGFASAPKRRLIRNIKDLGGRAISVQDLKPNEEFILICAQPKWTEKFITACSTGLWILQPDFVEKSSAFGQWLREGQFEWSMRKRDLLGSGFGDERLLEAPRRWRIHVASGGKRAFDGWNVLLMIKDKTNRAAFMRILTFGGALVIHKRECLNDEVWKSITHIFVDDDFCCRNGDIVKDLIAEGFQCLSTEYIRDYVAQATPPNVEDYYVGSPELFQSGPATLLKSLVSGLPSNGSVGVKPRKTVDNPEAQRKTRRGTRDERAKGALRTSVQELMPSTFVSRKQKDQLLKQDAVIVVESLRKTPSRSVKDGPRIKRLETKSSLVKCLSVRFGERKPPVDEDCCAERNVVFENISSNDTFGTSMEMRKCSSEASDFRAANDLRKRTIQDDVAFSCKQKKIARLSSDVRSGEESETEKRRFLRFPVLKEMTMESNFVVGAQQTADNALLNKKRLGKPMSSAEHSPLSHGQLLFLEQVVKEMVSPTVRNLPLMNPSIQNENETGSAESPRNRKEKTSSLKTAPSVGESQGFVTVRRLSEDIFNQNEVILSSTANRVSPLKQNDVMRNEAAEEGAINKRCIYHREQEVNSDFPSAALSPSSNCDSKRSLLTTSTEHLNRNQFEPTERNDSVALISDQTNLLPSCGLSSEFSNSDKGFEQLTLQTQPTTISSQLERTIPLKSVQFLPGHTGSHHQLVDTKADRIDSDKFLIIKGETRDCRDTQKSLPDATKRLPFSKSVAMFVDACLNDDEGTCFRDRESVQKFVGAVSSFVTPVSYPPSAMLTILLKMLIEEHQLDKVLRHQIATLLGRILWLHPPISVLMRQIYADALTHVSMQHQKWQLIEHLFRRVFECSDDDSCSSSDADLLFLQFIVRLLELDFVESKKRLLSSGSGKGGQSVRWSLVTQWIWTNEFAAVRSTQFVQLVALLMEALRLQKTHPTQMVVIGLAQKLVAMGAEAWLLSSVISTETSFVPRDPWMLALVIAEQLSDERKRSVDLMKVFLETCECNWLAMVICRALLDRMNPDGVVENTSLDLRTIMKYFDLRPYEEAASEDVDHVRAKSEQRLTPSKVLFASPKHLVKRSQKPKDVNKANTKGETQLHVACQKNNLEKIRELLQTPGIDVNRADNAGWTPLHEACNRGNIDAVKELLQFKPKRTINSYFTIAQPSSSQSIVREGGVDVRVASHAGGITPLHDAVINGHLDVCRLLLDHAGVELLAIVDKKGKSAMDYAVTDEMRRCLLLENLSKQKETMQRKPDKSEALPSVSLSSVEVIQSSSVSLTETARPVEAGESSAMALHHSIFSDCSQRYCLLVSSLVKFYVSWMRDKISGDDDRVILTELPEQVLRLRQNLLELQNGKLLAWQMAALTRLETLADLQLITTVNHGSEIL